MGLLADIQAALLDEQPIGPILLKMRFLAARLGSTALEDWVKHESEGYPKAVAVPSYRRFPVSYIGSFNGSFGRVISNVNIPPMVIQKLLGDPWLYHDDRQSIYAQESLLNSGKGEDFVIDASNLMGMLAGKVYSDMACHQVRGVVSRANVVEMLGTVRARTLELTIQFERNVAGASEIAVGQSMEVKHDEKATQVTNIFNQVINGPVGSNVANSGAGARFDIKVGQGQEQALAQALQEGGISEGDAVEFAAIAAAEAPEGPDQPFGGRAKEWIAANIGKALNGAWKVSAPAATALLTEAAKQFYGVQ